MHVSRTPLWRIIRERKILKAHKRIAGICQSLIDGYRGHPVHFDFEPMKPLDSRKIIWQYWAQGFDDVPPVVKQCLDSVEKYADDYTIVRLTDENLQDYLDLPDFVQQKRALFSRAFFSDLLRLMLLKTYGGIWMDATILMTGPIPKAWEESELFFCRRDPNEPDYRYWRNTYAYYFGWAKGFRVNMLSSFMMAKKGGRTISELCDLMLLWWKEHSILPDYFFLQILIDVYHCPDEFPLVSDTLPHYLQQSLNDPGFHIIQRELIPGLVPIHKMNYKVFSRQFYKEQL